MSGTRSFKIFNQILHSADLICAHCGLLWVLNSFETDVLYLHWPARECRLVLNDGISLEPDLQGPERL